MNTEEILKLLGRGKQMSGELAKLAGILILVYRGAKGAPANPDSIDYAMITSAISITLGIAISFLGGRAQTIREVDAAKKEVKADVADAKIVATVEARTQAAAVKRDVAEQVAEVKQQVANVAEAAGVEESVNLEPKPGGGS